MTSALANLTADALDALPDAKLLQHAVAWAREDTAPDAADNDPDAENARMLVDVLDVAATAAASGNPDDHRAVTAALARFARVMLRAVLADQEGIPAGFMTEPAP